MLWNLAEPMFTRWLQRHLRVESIGDDASDQRSTFLFQQSQHALLLNNQAVDASGFAIEVA
ncbi:hypothetical protein D3C87_1715960 [compost metagenome]